MTLHVAYRAIESARISRGDSVTVTKSDTAKALGWNSSVMYLEEGMRVDVLTLMRGLAVVSANDAAFALARAVSGSVELFVREMNAEASAMGLGSTRFEEPSGLSPNNVSTVRDLAQFSRVYARFHPGAFAELHALPYLDFPLRENMPPGRLARTNRFPNRNPLLGDYPGCDGLKTGFIEESGFNFVATAERSGMRLVAVLLGAPDAPSRAEDARRLLDFGFQEFATVRPELPALPPVRVWGGSPGLVTPVPSGPIAATVRREDAPFIVARIETNDHAKAPLARGAPLGAVTLTSKGKVAARIPLVSPSDAAEAAWPYALADSLQYGIRSALGMSLSAPAPRAQAIE